MAEPTPVVAVRGGGQGNSARRRARAAQVLFLAPAVVYIVLFFGYPAVKNMTMSVQDYTTRAFITGEAPWIGLDNYADVVSSSIFSKAVLNTVLFTAGSIVGQFVIGMLLALFFRRRFPLNAVMRSLLLLPWLVPLIVSGTVWRWILDQDGGVLNQTLRGLGLVEANPGWLTSPSLALVAVVVVNIWIGIPFNTTILYGGLQEIPKEVHEAAALDGAGRWREFWAITWPLLRPVVTVALVLGVVYTLKVIDIILALTDGGPANASQTIATQSYQLSFQQFQFGQGAALSNLLIVVSLVFAGIYLWLNRRAVDE